MHWVLFPVRVDNYFNNVIIKCCIIAKLLCYYYGSYFHKMPVLPNGCRVGFSRLRDFNSNVFNTLDTIRLVFAMYDICINEDPLAPEWCLVLDMTGFSIGHLTKLTNLTLMKKCLNYVQVILSYTKHLPRFSHLDK